MFKGLEQEANAQVRKPELMSHPAPLQRSCVEEQAGCTIPYAVVKDYELHATGGQTHFIVDITWCLPLSVT